VFPLRAVALRLLYSPFMRFVRRGLVAHIATAACFTGALGCEPDFGEPGLSWRGFQTSWRTLSPPQAAIVLVVDDRSSAGAVELRAGMGAAMRHLGADALRAAGGSDPDWAAWHPMDVTVTIVPASAASLDAAITAASDPRLGWTTNRATPATAEDLARAVEEHVRDLAAPEGAPFQPLARAREVERSLRAAGFPRAKRIAVAIVASTDDASPGPTRSYRLDSGTAVIGLATSARDRFDDPDPLIYPRLIDWSDEMIGSPFKEICDHNPPPPFLLFGRPCQAQSESPSCPGYAIAESAPGMGRCLVEITTPEPVMCDPSRGWINPLASNGARRPRVTKSQERICEVLPVDSSVMDACVHDENCTDCGSGWCISKVPLAKFCPVRPALPIRWVGGALPAPGTVRITCLEGLAPAHP